MEVEKASLTEPVIQNEEPVDELIVDEPDANDIPSDEPQPIVPPGEPRQVHPLAPGGKRFEQVYRQAKDAQRELVTEREKRIRAETLLEEKSKVPSTQEKTEYSWAELEPMIVSGQITRADAEAHREQVLKKKVTADLRSDLTRESNTATRVQTLSRSVDEYLTALPMLTDIASVERRKVDGEFDWLVQVQGLDPAHIDEPTRKALQLTALRNAFGSIDGLTKRTAGLRVETAQGLPGGARPNSGPVHPDQALLNKLTEREVTHYKRMIETGRYKNGWNDVVAELKFKPGVKPVVKPAVKP